MERTCHATTKAAFDIPSHFQTDTPAPYAAHHTATDAGSVAADRLRWINTRGEEGPRSPKNAGATIGSSRRVS